MDELQMFRFGDFIIAVIGNKVFQKFLMFSVPILFPKRKRPMLLIN